MVEVAVFRFFLLFLRNTSKLTESHCKAQPREVTSLWVETGDVLREREGWEQLAASFSKPRASNKYPVSVGQERKKEGKKDVQVSEVAGTVLGRISSPSPFPSRERVCVERMELLLLFAMLFFAVRRLRNKNGNS